MKEPASLAANYYAYIDRAGKLHPQAEVALVLAEPQYRVDLGGDMIRERKTETTRFAASPDGLRQMAKRLEEFAEDLETDFEKAIENQP